MDRDGPEDTAQRGDGRHHWARLSGGRSGLRADQLGVPDARHGLAAIRAQRVRRGRGVRGRRVRPRLRGPPAVRGRAQPVRRRPRPRAPRVRLQLHRTVGG